MAGMSIRALCLFTALLYALPAPAQEGPRRIASLNLCTDELVLRLAGRERIATLSYFAADPRWSPVAALATGLHLNRGGAEEVLARDPDLILSSRFSAGAAVAMLRRLGFEPVVLDFPATLEESYAQIRQVAALLGEPVRGEALIAAMRSDIEAAQQALQDMPADTLAVFYASNGYSHGAGTLRDDFLASLGWRNLAAEVGLQGPGRLPLEILLAARPDYLLVESRDVGGEHLAHRLLKHPAMRVFGADQVIELPDSLFQCAGPSLAAAYRRLAAQLAPSPHQLPAAPRP